MCKNIQNPIRNCSFFVSLDTLLLICDTISNLMSICDLFGKDLEPKTVEFAHFADLEFSKNARLLNCTGFH